MCRICCFIPNCDKQFATLESANVVNDYTINKKLEIYNAALCIGVLYVCVKPGITQFCFEFLLQGAYIGSARVRVCCSSVSFQSNLLYNKHYWSSTITPWCKSVMWKNIGAISSPFNFFPNFVPYDACCNILEFHHSELYCKPNVSGLVV